MKTLKLLLLTIFFLPSIVSSQTVKKHGQLSVDGIFLVDQTGEPVMLNGVSYGWHNWWPRFYNESSVKWLAEDWNTMVVRAAMGIEPENGYLKSPEWSKKKIESVIRGAIKSDIYVIIDWHSHSIQLEAAKEFFAGMAKKYGGHPHVIYEIYNEPVDDTWNEVKDYSIEVIETIRKYDPDNIILVGSPHWDQDVHIVADDPIEGFDNIMYSLHFYAGSHGKSLRERGDYAMAKGIPLFVSESGSMKASGDGPIDYEELEEWISWMEKNKISFINWSIADKDETCSMLKKSASSEGGWKEEDMKESGLLMRKYLRENIELKK